MAQISISNFEAKVPFGLVNEDFISVDDILGKPVEILDIEKYVKDDTDRVSVLMMIDGEKRFTRTASTTAVPKLTKGTIVMALAAGDTIVGKFIKRKSLTSERTVTDFVAY